MLKGIFGFFISITVVLLLLVYFAGDYQLDFGFVTTKLTGGEVAERNLIYDHGIKRDYSYSLTVTNRGVVDFQKNDDTGRDFRNFKIEDKDIKTIREQMDKTGIFKIVSLDRNYCLDRYESRIEFDFGWIHKNVDYSNCNDDPSELRNFRSFLYKFLGLDLKGASF